MLRITARRAGFRRCGIAHPAAPVDYPADRFSAAELRQLQAEPLLVVEILPAVSGVERDPPTSRSGLQAATAPRHGRGKKPVLSGVEGPAAPSTDGAAP